MDRFKSLVEALMHNAGQAISKAHTFMQTPLGSAIAGGLVVVLVAHYGLGFG